jgi:Domain of unknown function (DUF4328)
MSAGVFGPPQYRVRPLGQLGRAVQIGLIGTAGLSVVRLVSAVVELRDLPSAHVDRLGVLGFGGGAWVGASNVAWAFSFLATAGLWLTWEVRAYENLAAVRRPEAGLPLRYTPSWAILWWFVPFANLGVPLSVAFELERRSRPDAHARARYLVGAVLWIWWLCLLISIACVTVANSLLRFSTRIYEPDLTPPRFAGTFEPPTFVRVGDRFLVVGDVAAIVAAICAVFLVARITGHQRSWRQSVVPVRPDEPASVASATAPGRIDAPPEPPR